MLRRLGYVAIALSIDATSNKGAILRNATPERLRDLIGMNLVGLRAILEFNMRHAVRMYRISSQVIPFGGHPVNTLAWWEEFATPLAELGAFIRAHDMRVSMHPGQYTLLSSADPRITDAARADLAWHCRLLDAMGLDGRHKLVIHGGGAYGDKPSAMERFVACYRALPEALRRRLVLENDERVYSATDVLQLSERTGIPVVLDTLHFRLNPGAPEASLGDTLRDCFGTWGPEDGPPKTHFSSQAPGLRPGAHANDADPDEFAAFLREAPERPFDCMLETKSKDLALFRLREELAARGIREQDLIPVPGPDVRNRPVASSSQAAD